MGPAGSWPVARRGAGAGPAARPRPAFGRPGRGGRGQHPDSGVDPGPGGRPGRSSRRAAPSRRRGQLTVLHVAAGPAVHFGTGRGPAPVTHVQLDAFEGPLGLLLTLIESRQLDILTVSL